MVESGTQARLIQAESEHWLQQQRSPGEALYLQLASRFVQGLPGETRMHSDQRYSQYKTNRRSRKKNLNRRTYQQSPMYGDIIYRGNVSCNDDINDDRDTVIVDS